MDKIINFQMSLFGSFINIQPDQEITMRLMGNLVDENMIPATVTVATVEPMNKKISDETRMQMISQDKSWTIVFFQERIDITYSYIGGNVIYSNFKDIYDKGIVLLKKTFATFSDTIGNRLAVNARVVLPEFSIEEKAKFIKRFSTPLSMFDENDLDDWNLHYNMRKPLSFGTDKSEICNNIVDIGDIITIDSQNGTKKNRMSIGLDINTLAENVNFRFKYTDLEDFADNAQIEMEKIVVEVEEG